MLLKLFGFHVVPAEIVQGFEKAIERFAFVYEGNGDPDRPIELLEEPFEQLRRLVESSPHAAQMQRWAGHLASAFKFVAERPSLRSRLARKALRMWRAMHADVAKQSHPFVSYLDGACSMAPAASILALGVWHGLDVESQAKLIQANTYLEEARTRVGEGRFNSIKKLALVLLVDLYPKYVESLCVIESARLARSVTPQGKQARSFGSMLRALSTSGASALIDPDAHKIRNAFAHSHVRWVRETDAIEMKDEQWSWSGPASEALARLERMHTCYLEAMVITLVHGSDLAVRVAEKSLTWEVLTEKRPDFEEALHAAIEPTTARLRPWFENQQVSPRLPTQAPTGAPTSPSQR